MSSIKSIIKKKVTGTLHNIAVEEDESYIANDLIVHNCRSILVPIMSGDNENSDSYYKGYKENIKPFGSDVPSDATQPELGFGGSGNK